jgi:shikimate kinase
MSAKAPSRRCVVLIGFMGAGKTTVGRTLAKRLRCQFLDLDDVIQQRERKSVAEIFASSGEAVFRRMENAALKAVLDDVAGDLVLSLGGGAFVQEENRAALDRAGAVTVLLEAPLEELRRRCDREGKARPLAQEPAKFDELFAARRADYDLAQHTVHTLDKKVKQIAAEIERLLRATNVEVEK